MRGRAVRFTIPGTPVVQGNLRRSPSGGLYSPNAPRIKTWRGDVMDALIASVLAGRGSIVLPRTPHARPIFPGAVSVTVIFYLPRPKAHRRVNGELRPSAPLHPAGRPDLDKTLRALGDALTAAGAWADDAQVVEWIARKAYADLPSTVVEIEELV